jgi:hypothetical protein
MSRSYRLLEVSGHRVTLVTWAVLAALVLAPNVGLAQSPEATILHKFAWDYSDLVIAEHGIVRFELRIDGGAEAAVGMSALEDHPGSYVAPVPPMTVGQHLLEVRACSPTSCGSWSSPLLFGFSPPAGGDILDLFGGSLPLLP